MDELHTPAGYVEYPRDPKYRSLNAIERLELLGIGYVKSKYVVYFVVLLNLADRIPKPNERKAIEVLLTMGLAWALWYCLSFMCRGLGWPRWVPSAVAAFMGILGLDVAIGVGAFVPHSIGLGMWIVIRFSPFLAWIGSYWVAARQFRKVGLRFSTYVYEDGVKRMVADLRSVESRSHAG